jgi:hypothetical protein
MIAAHHALCAPILTITRRNGGLTVRPALGVDFTHRRGPEGEVRMTIFNRRSLLPLALLVALSGGPVACSDCNLSVNTTFLPDGFVGVYYSAGLNSACGGDAWALQTGDLPPGINLQENGFIQGFPTRAGTFTFTVAVIDFHFGEVAYGGLEIRVHEQGATPTETPVEE